MTTFISGLSGLIATTLLERLRRLQPDEEFAGLVEFVQRHPEVGSA